MSVRAIDTVWRHSTLTGSARLVLLAIADYAADDGLAWPKLEALAAKSRVSVRQVRRALARAAFKVEPAELAILVCRDRSVPRQAYRLLVGDLVDAEVDYDRLPFRLVGRLTAPRASGGQVVPLTAESCGHTGSSHADIKGRSTRARHNRVKPSVEPSETVSDGDAASGIRVAANPNGFKETAQTLVARFVDECRSRDADPPKRVVGQFAREAGNLLVEGVSSDDVWAGALVLIAKGLNPSALSSCVHGARLTGKTATSKGGTDGLDAYVRA